MAKRMRAAETQSQTTITKNVSRVPRSLSTRRLPGKARTGFPERLVMKHKYTGAFTLNGTTGMSVNSFKANGMFDPDTTSVGHQPLYYDQMTAIYDHYCVKSSKIKITFGQDTQLIASVVGIYLNDDSAVTPSSFTAASEQRNAVVTMMPKLGTTGPRTLKLSFNSKKMFGADGTSNPTLAAAIGADPSELAEYTIFAQSADVTTSYQVTGLVEIEYTAEWFELKDIAGS